MKMVPKFIILTGVAALLGACESSSVLTFDDLQDGNATMTAKYLTADGNLLPGLSATQWSDVPVSGDATYNGFVAGALPSGDLIGQLELTVDFVSNNLSGTADNFRHETNGSYEGGLSLTGPLNRGTAPTIPQISGTLIGTLTNDGKDHATVIALDGDLIGTDYNAVGGYADGSIGTEVFEGTFVAEN